MDTDKIYEIGTVRKLSRAMDRLAGLNLIYSTMKEYNIGIDKLEAFCRQKDLENFLCPECGTRLVFMLPSESVLYELNPDGSVGRILCDKEGLNSIRRGTDLSGKRGKFFCRTCKKEYDIDIDAKDKGFVPAERHKNSEDES